MALPLANQQCQIKDLVPHRSNFILDALVIAKSSVRWLGGAQAGAGGTPEKQPPAAPQQPSFFVQDKQKSSSRCVFNCTLRDSISDFVNLSVWGESEDVAASFHIGDVVRIVGARVVAKKFTGDEDKYAPPTPALVDLSLSTTFGSIRVIGSGLAKNHPLTGLLSQPVRDPSDYLVLAQVMRMGRRLENSYVNLLAVVKSTGKERHVKSRKDGHDFVCCDVHILDSSCTDFVITFWDAEMINFAKSYWQKNEIVFFTDVMIKYDENKFRRGFSGSSTVRTIAIPNPMVPDAERLRRLVQDDVADIFGNNDETENELDVSQITEQFSVNAARRGFQFCSSKMAEFTQQRASSSALMTFASTEQTKSSLDQMTISGYLFGYLTRVAIVEPISDFARLSCANCGRFLDGGDEAPRQCPDSRCRVAFSSEFEASNGMEPVWRYRISIDVSDDSGTLNRLYLTDRVGQKLFKLSAGEMVNLEVAERCRLKWRLLFEKFKIYFKIQPSQFSGKLWICVLDIFPADPLEMCGLTMASANARVENEQKLRRRSE